MTTTPSQWLEVALVLFMLIGLVLVLYERIKSGKGPWKGTVQTLAVILVFPTIILLAFEGKVKEDATATLLGALIGYVLSGMGKETTTNSPTPPDQPKPK